MANCEKDCDKKRIDMFALITILALIGLVGMFVGMEVMERIHALELRILALEVTR